MISIVDLNGGFGNQLFQYSLAIKLKKMGFSVHIYDPTKVDYFNKKIDGINKTNNLKLMSLQNVLQICVLLDKVLFDIFSHLRQSVKPNK